MPSPVVNQDRERLSIIHTLAPGIAGGLESVVSMLAVGQQRRGDTIRVLSVLEQGQLEPTLHAQLFKAGVEVIPVSLPPRSYLKEIANYRNVFDRYAPDIVHMHGYRPDLLAAPVARRRKAAVVTTVHGFTGGDWKNRLYERLQLRSFRKLDAVVAVSQPLSLRLAAGGVPSEKLVVIPNAFDATSLHLSASEARRVLGIAADEIVLGWVGRLSREKGLDVLLNALALLPSSAMLSVIGDGQEHAALVHQVSQLGLGGRVRFHGMIPDAGRLYPAFDIFVLSSRTEGTPISLLEAMSADIPIVATRVGGVPDVVSEREACLVEPESPAELAVAIEATLTDRPGRFARAAQARVRLETAYALEPWLERYAQLYRNLTSSRRAENR
ncbi:MAG: glycosyltransferase [Gemmatimonadota bacterium]